MGKVLVPRFPDLSHRILKKPVRRDKSSASPSNKNDGSKNDTQPNKRKIAGINDEDLPVPLKLPKLSIEVPKLLSVDQAESQEDVQGLDKTYLVVNKISAEKNPTSDCIYLKIQDESCDLFWDDELKNSHFKLIYNDLYFHIMDEICLEGLDGITFEAFWKRMLVVLKGVSSINLFMKDSIWKIIISKHKHVNFYELPSPRRELDIYNRYDYYNSDIGVVMELVYELPDIYPHSLVIDANVQGSCANFQDRVDVSETVLTLQFANVGLMYGNKLVVVANQGLRKLALTGEFSDPLIEMPNMEYCILERIGRSRSLGETTQGNMSLTSAIKMDSKSMFHYRRQLYRNSLISKQFFYIKSAITEQNKSGKLLHLRRFYSFVKSRYLLIADKAINIIKRQPNYRIEVAELRKMFSYNTAPVLKMFKTVEFRKYVKTDCIYPYRFMYPNARKSEYFKKSGAGEKILRCYELKNPHVNVIATWNNDHDDSDEEEDEDEGDTPGSKFYNMEVYRELYYHIHSTGTAGLSSFELNRILGVDKNTCRMALKKLVTRGVVDIEKFDKGRQRSLLYRARFPQTGEPSEPVVTSRSTASCSIKARLIERQRAALLQSKQDERESPPTTPKPPPKLSPVRAPPIPTCSFLIRHRSGSPAPDPADPPIDLSLPLRPIKLSCRPFGPERFDLNGVLAGVKASRRRAPHVEPNFDGRVRARARFDPIAKLVLLKALLGEAAVKGATCLPSGPQEVARQIPFPKADKTVTLLEFMGERPVRVFYERDKNVTTEIYMSTPPENEVVEFPELDFISERVASRGRMIIDITHRKKIFEDPSKMLKLIQDEEAKTGYEKKMDRKSLNRILKRFVEEGYIKIYKICIHDSNIMKTLSFICHPSISHKEDQIQSSCQQIKWKYFIGCVKKTLKPNVSTVIKKVEDKLKTASPFTESDVMNSIDEMKHLEKLKIVEMKNKYGKNAGKTYGVKPKFIRMRIVHEFLFYLVYEYEPDRKPVPKREVEEMLRGFGIEISQEELRNLPTVYCKEISWKMFIPPLPEHKSWSKGWALMCDVILRLPISVLCKVHNCPFNLPELYDTLRHPIKRFYLIKDLSENIRTVTLYKRKYLFSIHDSIIRLAYIGLIQYGPQKYKEKDQFFIYLNRRASLLDTTSSEPSYNKIQSKEYPKLAFYFNSQAEVDSYWFNLHCISMSTKLNARTNGELVTLTDISANKDLMKTVKSRTCEEALAIDNGDIPGDKKGAAGLDSAMWVHLMRNWFWDNRSTKSTDVTSMGLRKERMDKVLPQEIEFKNLILNRSNKIYLTKPAKEAQVSKKHKLAKTKAARPCRTSKSHVSLSWKISRRGKPRLREYYDATDRAVLKRIGVNRRVAWSGAEDRALLLCKAADLLLHNGKTRKQFVPYGVIRDVLHRLCGAGETKTSKAVQRRLKIVQSGCFPPLEDVYANLLRVRPIHAYYSTLLANSWKASDEKGCLRLGDKQICAAFVILMAYVGRHQDEIMDVLQGNSSDIDHLSDRNLEHTVREMVEMDNAVIKFKDAASEEDIKRNVLKSVIHSSVVCPDSPSTALQLLKLYQTYPDNLIRSAVEELRRSNTITVNKFHRRKEKLWQTPYHLSQQYIFYQFATHNQTTAVETYKTFSALKPYSAVRGFVDFSEQAIIQKRYGQLLGTNEFFTFWNRIKFHFYVPQTMIILNPDMTDHEELINELALRYQLKQKKMQQQESNENDQDTESDISAYRSKPNATTVPAEEPSVPPMDVDEVQADAPDPADIETINRLRTWVSDCITGERETRSPSPEFVAPEERLDREAETDNPVVASEKSEGSGELEEESASASASRRLAKDRVLTLDEIKEEMVRATGPNEERVVPYITELSDLLTTKDASGDTGTDEETIRQLRRHFVAQYARLEDVEMEDVAELAEHRVIRQLENVEAVKKVWERVQSDVMIGTPLPLPEVTSVLREWGGQQEDVDFMMAVVDFVAEKGVLGCTGQQLKDRFLQDEKTLSLIDVVKLLVDCQVLLQAGIYSIRFVHYRHREIWLVETYQMTEEEQNMLQDNKPTAGEEASAIQFEPKKKMVLQMSPWHKMSGTLNRECFKTWICCTLSHCLDCPGITFRKLCEKFFYLKPVDVYYILMVLEELGCIELMCYESKEENLFSKWEAIKQRRATFLDNLDDIMTAPTNVPMTRLGSFLYHDQVSEA